MASELRKIPPITEQALINYCQLLKDMGDADDLDEDAAPDAEFAQETYTLMAEEINERWPALHKYLIRKHEQGETDFAAGMICAIFTMMMQEAIVESDWVSNANN